MMSGLIVLTLPITIIGANFDEEYEKSQRQAALDRKSRVVQYNVASRNGTRPVRPPRPSIRESLWRSTRVTPHDDGGAPKADAKFSDQGFNVQSDISMLLDEHFEQLREKFDGMLMRHTTNLNRWISTDLRFVDNESKALTQAQLAVAARFSGISSASKHSGGGGGSPRAHEEGKG